MFIGTITGTRLLALMKPCVEKISCVLLHDYCKSFFVNVLVIIQRVSSHKFNMNYQESSIVLTVFRIMQQSRSLA